MTDLYNIGDAVRGEKIICVAHKVEKPELIRMTGMHRGSRVILKGNVTCIIDVALQNIGS